MVQCAVRISDWAFNHQIYQNGKKRVCLFANRFDFYLFAHHLSGLKFTWNPKFAKLEIQIVVNINRQSVPDYISNYANNTHTVPWKRVSGIKWWNMVFDLGSPRLTIKITHKAGEWIELTLCIVLRYQMQIFAMTFRKLDYISFYAAYFFSVYVIYGCAHDCNLKFMDVMQAHSIQKIRFLSNFFVFFY